MYETGNSHQFVITADISRSEQPLRLLINMPNVCASHNTVADWTQRLGKQDDSRRPTPNVGSWDVAYLLPMLIEVCCNYFSVLIHSFLSPFSSNA
jgi:hypothetical protein